MFCQEDVVQFSAIWIAWWCARWTPNWVSGIHITNERIWNIHTISKCRTIWFTYTSNVSPVSVCGGVGHIYRKEEDRTVEYGGWYTVCIDLWWCVAGECMWYVVEFGSSNGWVDVYYDPASIMVTWVWLVVNCIMREMWYAFMMRMDGRWCWR